MKAYGIDFGTTNSSVAFYKDGKADVLKIEPQSSDPYVLRSVLYIKPDSKILIGNDAINEYIQDIAKGEAKITKQIFTGRFIKKDKDILGDSGWRGTEMVPELIKVEVGGEGRLMMSLKSAASSKMLTNMNIFGKFYSIEKLLSLILSEIKSRSDKITGENITNVVLGRPVKYVGGNEKIAIGRMKEAAKIAGFKKIYFEYEPIGAAWDYGLETKNKETIMVFDFGGGTLDLSVVSFPGKKIIANDGIAIGGDLLNSRLFEKRIAKYFGSNAHFGDSKLPLPAFIIESLKNPYAISQLKTEDFLRMLYKLHDTSTDKEALKRLITLVNNNLGYKLYESIDNTKKALSLKKEAEYTLNDAGLDIRDLITREEFEKIVAGDLVLVNKLIDNLFIEIGMQKIDYVVTTGGSSLIPAVQTLLKMKFGVNAVKSRDTFTSVARGLALRAEDLLT